MNKTRSVLITGGAGFIGSHLCEEFIKQNYKVICVDNFFRGKRENIKSILRLDNFKLFEIDLNNNESIIELVKIITKFLPEYIFHYAAINGTEYFYDIPYEVVLTNSISTYHLTNAMEKIFKEKINYKPKIIFASSSEVYGSAEKIPTSEKEITYLRTSENRDSYAAGKLISEFYIKLFAQKYNIDYFIFRIFNVYGPRMINSKYGQVVPELIKKIKTSSKSLKIIGSGTETRSFCFIDDHINLTIKAVKFAKVNQTYNIGNPYEVEILELAKLICSILGKNLIIKNSEPRSGDHSRRCPNVDKLIDFIGDYPFLSLEEGIKKMLL